MRDQKRNCEANKIRADGVVLVKSIFIDQHHPGAHQEMGHPTSAEEGTLFFSYCPFIHTL